MDLPVPGMLYETVVPTHHRRHAVRPGGTGLAQVVGSCGIVGSIAPARPRLAGDILRTGVRGPRFDLALIAWTARRLPMRGGRGSLPFPLGRLLPDTAARTAD